MSEKNLDPTDKKIEDAREQGQVAISTDLVRLSGLVALGEVAFILDEQWSGAIQSLMLLSFKQIGQPFTHAMNEMILSAEILLLAVFGICCLLCSTVVVAATWGQIGVLVAPKALEPKFEKINPAAGLKNIFSLKKLIGILITTAKFALITLMAYVVFRSELPDIVSLAGGDPKYAYAGAITLLKVLFHILIVVCLCLALLDYFMQRYFHKKSLMMNMEDMKQEFKESEGDPMIKGKRKQLAMELAMSGEAAKQTEDANAVVVNPTHFAVAMFYDGDSVRIPVVRAKGKDHVAKAIIARAKEKGIPVIRHVWLARTLYATGKTDGVVPKVSYEAVADVYAVIEELRRMNEMDRVIELNSDGNPP